MIRRSNPTFRMTSSTSPRAFTNAPTARDSRHVRPPARMHKAVFADGGDCDNDSAHQPEVHAVDQGDARAQTVVDKQHRQEQNERDRFGARLHCRPESMILRHDETGEKRSEQRMKL